MRPKSIDALREEVAWELADRAAESAAKRIEEELPGLRITGDQLHMLAEKIFTCISVDITIFKKSY